MGEKDITEKILEDHNDVFADIINGLIFAGEQRILPESLENTAVHSQYKADDEKVHELERDVAKYWKDQDVQLAICGIENQSSVEKYMPFRIIGYDGTAYRSQLQDKRKEILPVMTIVLYFGTEHRWYGKRNLCKKYNKMLRLKGVVFTSENWTAEDIEIVQSVFKCKVVSTYGHTERAVFGYIVDEKCIFDKLYGYTELIPTDIENEFQIACTGFISHKMPLIRYVTDDVIQVQEDGSYKLIGHRKSEVKLIGKNGFPIFKGAMTLHMAETQKVRAYQYVQNEIGKVELHIVEEQELTKKELENIKKYIDQRCEGLLDVEIKIVHEVRHTPRGKYIWAICNIEQ